ncbi:branched-chain amino acid ABC transporter permease [Pseudonocardia sp. RS11V-5]|uniref:branched-chain amino acid ABC transporter permease n=1 Tax=Pseudonocardia terrae TaxID=2905831 RepID=UPI001E4ACF5C|nr:branched-chain amino acid ABC transporter permease [Pseudonocardia terrae]MCE3550880.1 branched-chain amino acid ABC transporter permease [Pseudonocardia terrae]
MQELINGIVQGSVFALVATGLLLIFSIVRVPHFAHGESVMIGGMVTTTLVTQAHLPLVLALVLGAVSGLVLGLLMCAGLYWPLRHYPEVSVLAASLAVVLLIETVATLIWGADPRVTPTDLSGALPLASAQVQWDRVILVAAALVFVTATWAYVHHTPRGRAMRAMALNRTAALLMGIPVRRYWLIAFAIGSGLAGAAGALYSLSFGVSATMGSQITLNAFIVIVFAGVGSIFGAFGGGLLLGIVQSFGGSYISAGYQEMFGFVVMVVILIVKPQGLFGAAKTA